MTVGRPLIALVASMGITLSALGGAVPAAQASSLPSVPASQVRQSGDTGYGNPDDFNDPYSESCQPLIILSFRGSGEGNVATAKVTASAPDFGGWQSEQKTTTGVEPAQRYGGKTEFDEFVSNGWEGRIISRLYQEYAQDNTHAKDSLLQNGGDSVQSLELGTPKKNTLGETAYPAIPIPSAITALSDISNSAVLGGQYAIGLTSFLDSTSFVCPNFRYLIVGYSQGAMAARQFIQQEHSRVYASILIGDPYRSSSIENASGSGVDHLYSGQSNGLYNQIPVINHFDDYYHYDNIKRYSMCHVGDQMCDLEPTLRLDSEYPHRKSFERLPIDGENPCVHAGRVENNLTQRNRDGESLFVSFGEVFGSSDAE